LFSLGDFAIFLELFNSRIAESVLSYLQELKGTCGCLHLSYANRATVAHLSNAISGTVQRQAIRTLRSICAFNSIFVIHNRKQKGRIATNIRRLEFGHAWSA